MPGFRSYSLYKGFRLYLPLEKELPRLAGGGFCVHAAMGRLASDEIELVAMPDCTAADYDEATHLSMTYAMRLAETGWWRSTDLEAEARQRLKAA